MVANGLDPRRFAEILDSLYRGVEDPEAWSEALARIGEALRAPVIARHSFDLVRKVGVVVGVQGISPALQEAYNVHYSRTNLWMARARGSISAGGLVVSDDLLPERDLYGTEWYEEFLKTLGIFRSMGAVLEIEKDISTTILFGRPREHGAYAEEDRRLLLSFVPHLQNVHRFRTRMARFDAVRDSLSAALDSLGHGVLLAEPDGRISFLNPAARRVVDLRDGLSLGRSGLQAAAPSEDALLRRRIQCASVCPPEGPPREELIRISRPSGARPFEVLVLPVPSGVQASGPQHRGALVLLHDPDSVPVSESASLHAAYGLTPAEARLAELVARGEGLHSAAALLEISIDTARTHLKRIFSKTNTHRQSQLAQLLLGSLARVGRR